MDDLISRQAAIDALRKLSREDGYIDLPHEYVTDAVRALPSAQPDVPDTNVGDMISRQAAIDAIKKYMGDYELSRTMQQVMLLLPPAQPEIVRCKDCKYWREHKYAKETKRYIPFCGFNAIYTKADDFCSRAERRGE